MLLHAALANSDRYLLYDIGDVYGEYLLYTDQTMRKIIVLSFISLDGVMQAPGGSKEDESGGFSHGGWTVPFFDETLGQIMGEQMSRPFDLLLGRKTFEIFASYWPDHQQEGKEINQATKYVVSTTLDSHVWQKSIFLKGDIPQELSTLKQQTGPDLQVHGSGCLIQTLLTHDLVDELWLKIFPITLGNGKRLFGEGAIPAAFKLSHSQVTPSGVVAVNYTRNGKVQTGSF